MFFLSVVHPQRSEGAARTKLGMDTGAPGEAGCHVPAFPCLFVTTASNAEKEKEKKLLPGSRKKQAGGQSHQCTESKLAKEECGQAEWVD